MTALVAGALIMAAGFFFEFPLDYIKYPLPFIGGLIAFIGVIGWSNEPPAPEAHHDAEGHHEAHH